MEGRLGFQYTEEDIDEIIYSHKTPEEISFGDVLYSRNDLGPADAVDFLDRAYAIKKAFGNLDSQAFQDLKDSYRFGPERPPKEEPKTADIILFPSNKVLANRPTPNHSPKIKRPKIRQYPSQRFTGK